MRGSGHARYHRRNISISYSSCSPCCPGHYDHCRSPFSLVIVYHGKRPGSGQERGSIINVTYHRDRTSPALISPYSGNCLTPGAYDARLNKSVGYGFERDDERVLRLNGVRGNASEYDPRRHFEARGFAEIGTPVWGYPVICGGCVKGGGCTLPIF